MSSSLDYLDLCRLCLVKDRVSVPIFEDEGDVRQMFLKITACLPVKIAREDKLPKKICDDCVYKVELLYQFWNTTANAEKQLLQWLGEVGGLEDKQGYVTEVLDSSAMKQEQPSDNRLDGSIMQVRGHQNNMEMGMMNNMTLITMPTGSEQFTSVPMDTTGTVQTIPSGSSTQVTHDQIVQNQTAVGHMAEEESEEEDNSDEGCDNEEGLPVKEEAEEDPNDQSLEQTAFVNVPISCGEAGPSGLQQQKISEMSEMAMQPSNDVDPKSGFPIIFLDTSKQNQVQEQEKSNTIPITSNKDIIKTDDLQIDDTEYQCLLCLKRCRTKKLLSSHMVAHSDKRPHQCEFCLKLFKRSNTLTVHRRIHTRERKHVCEICGRAFTQASQLKIHRRRHLENYADYCSICRKGFITNAELHSHMNAIHGANQHVCPICGKSLSSSHALKQHARRHDPFFEPAKHQCEVCGKTFGLKSLLKTHAMVHAGERRRFDCDLCGRSLATKSSLAEHLRLHGNKKGLSCDICGMVFHKQRKLESHRRAHTGEKPFVCEICNKAFSQSSSLVIHRLHHSGQRPYSCPTCNKSFYSRSMLNGHCQIHAT